MPRVWVAPIVPSAFPADQTAQQPQQPWGSCWSCPPGCSRKPRSGVQPWEPAPRWLHGLRVPTPALSFCGPSRIQLSREGGSSPLSPCVAKRQNNHRNLNCRQKSQGLFRKGLAKAEEHVSPPPDLQGVVVIMTHRCQDPVEVVSPWDGVSCRAPWWFEPSQERRWLSCSLPAAAPRTSFMGRSEWVLVWKAPGSPREAGTVLSTRKGAAGRHGGSQGQASSPAVCPSVCLSVPRPPAGRAGGAAPHLEVHPAPLLFSFLPFKGPGSSSVRVCGALGFELISFVQPAPASHLCLQPVGKWFCFLSLFKRGGEGREKTTSAREGQPGSGPGAAQ